MWALRGLRNGKLTTRWPVRPDGYAAGPRGPAVILAQPASRAADAELNRLCPTQAISHDGAGLRLDQGRCIMCGRCVIARPDVFGWAAGPNAAALSKAALT